MLKEPTIPMRRRHWLVLYLVVALLAAGLFVILVQHLLPEGAEAGTLDAQQAAVASAFLDDLDAGRFEQAHAKLAPEAAAALSSEQLQQIWSTLPKQLGGAARRGEPRGETVAGHPVTTFPLQFPNATLDARISIDEHGLIDGFRLVPGHAPLAATPGDIAERPLEVAGLPGTLSLPASSATRLPAVVLVHGSGPNDRDETIGPNKPFRDLAHGLARHGVAVLRYDKRTLARPGDFADGAFTVDDETVADALAAVEVLRQQAEVDPKRVFVLGHSLGAMLAPRIGSRDPQLAGLILLAAPARPLEQGVVEQLAYVADLDGQRDDQEQAAIAAAEQAAQALPAKLDGGAPDVPWPLGLPEAYWRDLAGYDPVASAAALAQPLLVLQGGRDYQVTDADFERWRTRFADDPRVTLSWYPRLNHLFAAGEGPATPTEYLSEAKPVDPAVIDDIARWIDGH